MNSLRMLLIGAIVACVASFSAVAQFEDKVSDLVGPGDKTRAYGIVLPTGVTVAFPDGKTYGAGDVLMVPGENIVARVVDQETLEPTEPVQETVAFDNKYSYVKPDDGLETVAVFVTITTPGVIVNAEDGRTATTGDTIMLLVDRQHMKHTSELDAPPSLEGFQSK